MDPFLATKTQAPVGTGIAQGPERKNPAWRRSGLTLRLVVERYVAIGWTRPRVRDKQCYWRFAAPAPHFIGEMEDSWRRRGPLISRAVCSLSILRVKFKLLIAPIRNACKLLGAPLEFIIQKDGLRDFFHGLPRLLALLLQDAIRFVLADFHFALQDSLGALHDLAGFELAGQRGFFA